MSNKSKALIHLFMVLFFILTGCSPTPTLINPSTESNNSLDPGSGTTTSESFPGSDYSSFSSGSDSGSSSEETVFSSIASSGTVNNSQPNTNTNPYKGKTVYVIDISDMSEYEKAAVTVLQGIANRNAPNIFLLPGKSSELSKLTSLTTLTNAYSSSVINNYPYTEQFWIDYYSRIFGFTFQTVSFEQAVNKFSDLIKGIVYYDSPSFPAVAITAGGIYDAIPVNSDMIAQASYLKNLPVKLDLRNRFTDKYEAHGWAVDNLLSKCSKEMAGSIFMPQNGVSQNDYMVQNKAFVYELDYSSSSLQGYVDILTNGGNVPDKPLLDKILDHLDPLSFIWGWGNPSERTIVARLSQNGNVLICANMPNASFHSIIKPLKDNFSQKHVDTEALQLENKVYIAFATNEGDTYKSAGSLFNSGSWLQKSRGKVPVSWGVDPLLFDLFPALMEYYYETATPNDYFFDAAAGYGYFHPDVFNQDYLTDIAQRINDLNKVADTSIIDIWWLDNLRGNSGNFIEDSTLKYKWVSMLGVSGLMQWSNPAMEKTTLISQYPNYNIISSDLYYPFEKVPNLTPDQKPYAIAEYIKNQASKVPSDKPWFMFIYAGDPASFKMIADQLPTDRFKAVRLDELFALSKIAYDQIAGTSIAADDKFWSRYGLN